MRPGSSSSTIASATSIAIAASRIDSPMNWTISCAARRAEHLAQRHFARPLRRAGGGEVGEVDARHAEDQQARSPRRSAIVPRRCPASCAPFCASPRWMSRTLTSCQVLEVAGIELARRRSTSSGMLRFFQAGIAALIAARHRRRASAARDSRLPGRLQLVSDWARSARNRLADRSGRPSSNANVAFFGRSRNTPVTR